MDRSILARLLPGTALVIACLAGCSGPGSTADVAPQPSGAASTTAAPSATSAPSAVSSATSAAPSGSAAPTTSASASASGAPSASAAPSGTASAAPAAPHPLTVAELTASPPASGTVTILAYVLFVYTCPPCPPRAECKPCFPDSLQLGDAPKLVATAPNVFPPTAKVLLGDLPKPVVGKRYRIEAVVVAHGSTATDLQATKISPAP